LIRHTCGAVNSSGQASLGERAQPIRQPFHDRKSPIDAIEWLVFSQDRYAAGIARVDAETALRVPIRRQVIEVIVEPHRSLLIEMIRSWNGMSWQRQAIVLEGGERLHIVHGREIKAAAVLKNVTAEDYPAIIVPAVVHVD